MEATNIYYIIPSFPGYKISRQGVILDAKSNEPAARISGKGYTFSLTDATGKRRQIGLKRVYREVFNAEFCQDSTQDITGEEWKPIAGTNGKYLVSNKGRVKSLCYYDARILKPFDNGHGYQKVSISGKKEYIHRLVSLAFLGTPDAGKDTTHHRNADRKDNSLDNL